MPNQLMKKLLLIEFKFYTSRCIQHRGSFLAATCSNMKICSSYDLMIDRETSLSQSTSKFCTRTFASMQRDLSVERENLVTIFIKPRQFET